MPKLLFARSPLDAVEERKIRKLAGARHAPADWIRRAQIIALSWDGWRVPAIAATLGCSQKAVRYRLNRFAAEGLDGLGDRPGAGRRPRIGQDQRSRLIALVAGPPPGRLVRDGTGELTATDSAGAAVWTLDALTAAARAGGIDIPPPPGRPVPLAEGGRWRRPRPRAAPPAGAGAAGIDIARPRVRRTLRAGGVRWRRPRSWAASADREFGPAERGSWSTTRTRRRTPRSSPPTSSAR